MSNSTFQKGINSHEQLNQLAQLYKYKTAYSQLQHSFKNNIHVIKELQQENQILTNQINSLKRQASDQLQKVLNKQRQLHRQELQKTELGYAREIDLIKKQYEEIIMGIQEKIEKENQQNLASISKKYNKQITNLKHAHQEQNNKLLDEMQKHKKIIQSLQKANFALQQKQNQEKIKIISMQNLIEQLKTDKQSSHKTYQNYQLQLQSMKNSSNQWEQMLKSKIKQVQKQKNQLQEQLNQCKMINKQKLRKMKEQMVKKANSLQEQKQNQMRDLLRQVKQIKHKHQSIKEQNRQFKTLMQNSKSQKIKLSEEIQSLTKKINSLSNLQSKQKEFCYQIKIMENQQKHLKNQIQELVEQNNQNKHQIQELNQKREIAEKALERVKVQLINKQKELEEYKKINKKLSYEIQVKQNQEYPFSGQTLIPNVNTNNPLDKYQQKDAIKGEIDYSRCFTEDMGPIDDKFFMMQSQAGNKLNGHDAQSPKNQMQSLSRIHPNFLKKIGQLQVENNQYKVAIQRMKQQMENTKNRVQQKFDLKQRQIKILQKQSLSQRQRVNDKESQILMLKESLSMLKAQNQKTKQKVSVFINLEVDLKTIKTTNQQLLIQNSDLQTKIKRVKQELDDIILERDMLQNISGELKAELNQLKSKFQFDEQEQQYMEQSYTPRIHSTHYQQPKNNIIKYGQNNTQYKEQTDKFNPTSIKKKQKSPFNKSNIKNNQINQRQKEKERQKTPKRSSQTSTIPRRLHELIKQKKSLQVAGQRANLQHRLPQMRVEHAGTQSQKQILSKIREKSNQKNIRIAQKRNSYNKFARRDNEQIDQNQSQND